MHGRRLRPGHGLHVHGERRQLRRRRSGDDGHLRSTNGGTTFIIGSTNEPAGICSLTVSPDEANVLFMSVGTRIFESRDGGASWQTEFANNHSQGRIPFVKVNDRAGSAFDLWYGDIQLFRASCSTPTNTTSTNQRCPASGSWTNAQTGAHWDVGDIVFNPTAAIDACPVLFSNDGGIYYNQNISNPNCHDPNWEQPQTSVTALWLWDMDGNVRATAGQEGVYTGQQDTGAFGTRDAGQSTVGWRSPSCCDVFDVEAENGRVVYTTCCYNVGRVTRMYRDSDTMGGGSQIPTYPSASPDLD